MYKKIRMMLKGKKALALSAVLFLLLPMVGYCGNATGTVAMIDLVQGPTGSQNLDLAFVYPSTNIVSPIACATYNRYAINLTIPSGRAIYATLLAAKMAGTSVKFYGNTTCDLYSNSETLSIIQLQQ